jgi:hypothetical protein
MKWRALMASDGSKEKYAVCFSTHTVCKVLVHGRVTFEAWREGNPPVKLAAFSSEKAFEEAKLCVETDARDSSSSRSTANQSEHGTATREASQGRSSSSAKSRSMTPDHAASLAPMQLEIQ